MKKAPRINPIELIRRKGRRLVVAPEDETGERVVYAISHIQLPELGAAAIIEPRRLLKSKEEADYLQRRLERASTDEDRAKIEEEAKQLAERIQKEAEEDLFGSPEKQIEYVQRCRRIVSLAVRAVGVARPDAPTGPAEYGTEPWQVCLPLDESGEVFLVEVEVVEDREVEPSSGKISIHDYDTGELIRLAALFMAAFSVKSTVAPLPGAPGDADVGGAHGPKVRPASERVPARSRQGGGSTGRPVRGARE